MRKRVILVCCIAVLVSVAIFARWFFYKTPLLKDGEAYTVVHGEYWPDGYDSRQILDIQGKEMEILSCLSDQTQQRKLEGLFSGSGEAVSIPDWPMLVFTITSEDEGSFLILVGKEKSQRYAPGYQTPIYKISGQGDLWESLEPILEL